jgi:hypothetical protein
MWRNLTLCRGKDQGYRALMGRMLGRVSGLLVVLAIALVAPSVAAAAPNGSFAGWRSPAAGTMDVTVQATPDSATRAALVGVTVRLGGVHIATEPFADGTCSQTCPAYITLAVDTHEVPDGERLLEVTIVDVNGAEEILRQMITVDNKPVVSTPTVTVQIGSGTISPPSSPPPGGGVTPDAGPTCRAPQLSMRLAQKPLRYRRGVPVLARGRTYRYAGELTCRINGRRRPAPRGMEVQVRNRLLGGWTVSKRSLEVRKDGDVVARLAYRSSRTVIFRVRGAGGEVARVRIPIRVVRR